MKTRIQFQCVVPGLIVLAVLAFGFQYLGKGLKSELLAEKKYRFTISRESGWENIYDMKKKDFAKDFKSFPVAMNYTLTDLSPETAKMEVTCTDISPETAKFNADDIPRDYSMRITDDMTGGIDVRDTNMSRNTSTLSKAIDVNKADFDKTGRYISASCTTYFYDKLLSDFRGYAHISKAFYFEIKEFVPACSDGIDNDGDGWTDYLGPSDRMTDFMDADLGCESPDDDDEINESAGADYVMPPGDDGYVPPEYVMPPGDDEYVLPEYVMPPPPGPDEYVLPEYVMPPGALPEASVGD